MLACNHCGWQGGHASDCPMINPELYADRPRSRSGSTFGGCGCLLLVIAAIFAVGSFFFDVLVAQVAPDRGLTPQQVLVIKRVVGTWEGSYVCDGKRRGLRLEIKRMITKGEDLEATFSFYRGGKVSGTPLGAFTLEGEHNGVRMDLRPDSWEKHAPGFRMIDLIALNPSGDPLTMKGTLDRGRSSCGSFTVTKQ